MGRAMKKASSVAAASSTDVPSGTCMKRISLNTSRSIVLGTLAGCHLIPAVEGLPNDAYGGSIGRLSA